MITSLQENLTSNCKWLFDSANIINIRDLHLFVSNVKNIKKKRRKYNNDDVAAIVVMDSDLAFKEFYYTTRSIHSNQCCLTEMMVVAWIFV